MSDFPLNCPFNFCCTLHGVIAVLRAPSRHLDQTLPNPEDLIPRLSSVPPAKVCCGSTSGVRPSWSKRGSSPTELFEPGFDGSGGRGGVVPGTTTETSFTELLVWDGPGVRPGVRWPGGDARLGGLKGTRDPSLNGVRYVLPLQ